MLAVQIAAIVTISKGKSEANNLQQLYNNWEVVHVISISGFLPTSFNLLCLQSVGKRSWYLTILSTITVGISIVTLFRTGSFSPSLKDMDDLAKKSSTMEFCGNQDPTLYCLERYMDDATIGSSSTNIMLIFSLIILVYLIVDLLPIPKSMFYIYCSARLERSKTFRITAAMVARVLSKARQFLDLSYIWLAARRERNGFAASVLRISEYWRSMLVIFLYTSAWGLYLFFISELMSYFQLFLTYGMVNRTWNFGQIVGITVWAEPLVEFAYLELSTFLPLCCPRCRLRNVFTDMIMFRGHERCQLSFLNPLDYGKGARKPQQQRERDGATVKKSYTVNKEKIRGRVISTEHRNPFWLFL